MPLNPFWVATRPPGYSSTVRIFRFFPLFPPDSALCFFFVFFFLSVCVLYNVSLCQGSKEATFSSLRQYLSACSMTVYVELFFLSLSRLLLFHLCARSWVSLQRRLLRSPCGLLLTGCAFFGLNFLHQREREATHKCRKGRSGE